MSSGQARGPGLVDSRRAAASSLTVRPCLCSLSQKGAGTETHKPVPSCPHWQLTASGVALFITGGLWCPPSLEGGGWALNVCDCGCHPSCSQCQAGTHGVPGRRVLLGVLCSLPLGTSVQGSLARCPFSTPIQRCEQPCPVTMATVPSPPGFFACKSCSWGAQGGGR